MENIQAIVVLTGRIEEATTVVGTSNDKRAVRKDLKRYRDEGRGFIRKTKALLDKQPDQDSPVLKKTRDQFQNATTHFQLASEMSVRREREFVDIFGENDVQAQRNQVQLTEVDEKIIEESHRGMLEIEEDLNALHELFEQVGTGVEQTAEGLDDTQEHAQNLNAQMVAVNQKLRGAQHAASFQICPLF